MSRPILETPIVFIIFKRPDTTERVFQAIRQAQPRQLFVIADGPRSDRPGEAEQCAAVRQIVESVDWECEVYKNYSDVNLGCKRRVSSGLDWVFSQVEQAIILEDDCLPDPTFFGFCEEALQTYRNTAEVMMVCGTNILKEWRSPQQSYCFSYYSTCWGWATWKRAWQHYDIEMKQWREPETKNKIRALIRQESQYLHWEKQLELAYSDQVDTWALRWLFARWVNSGLSIIPAVNLISNVGFGEQGTHTRDSKSEVSNLPATPIQLPLREPNTGVKPDWEYANAFYHKMFKKKSLLKRGVQKLRKLIS